MIKVRFAEPSSNFMKWTLNEIKEVFNSIENYSPMEPKKPPFCVGTPPGTIGNLAPRLFRDCGGGGPWA